MREFQLVCKAPFVDSAAQVNENYFQTEMESKIIQSIGNILGKNIRMPKKKFFVCDFFPTLHQNCMDSRKAAAVRFTGAPA
ncbi:hypothetical protein [Rikenella microfusus]|uniref:hypothetical protein n=1 Tax=Rikenella microfusus TaxID=28139 RepID=UPI00040FBF16|nr:hypothetical protein [Rikenella microfusus]